jgi:hypothetical protein
MKHIDNPSILLLQVGNEFSDQLEGDKDIYIDFYKNVTTHAVRTTLELYTYLDENSFDLIHLFLKIDKDGYGVGSGNDRLLLSKLINLIKFKGTSYLIFAAENPTENYQAGIKDVNGFKMATIMTNHRNGESFVNFFREIVGRMSQDEYFFLVWNELAPQSPISKHENVPGTIAIMGAEKVALDASYWMN